MPKGAITPQQEDRIARLAAELPNRAAHRAILIELFRLGPSAERIEGLRARLWKRRAAVLAADPELARRTKAATKEERRAIRVATEAVTMGRLDVEGLSEKAVRRVFHEPTMLASPFVPARPQPLPAELVHMLHGPATPEPAPSPPSSDGWNSVTWEGAR